MACDASVEFLVFCKLLYIVQSIELEIFTQMSHLIMDTMDGFPVSIAYYLQNVDIVIMTIIY